MKEYMETLYDKNGKPQNEEMGIELELDVDEDSKGPVILDSEVINAIEALKVGKGQIVYQLSFGKYWE